VQVVLIAHEVAKGIDMGPPGPLGEQTLNVPAIVRRCDGSPLSHGVKQRSAEEVGR